MTPEERYRAHRSQLGSWMNDNARKGKRLHSESVGATTILWTQDAPKPRDIGLEIRTDFPGGRVDPDADLRDLPDRVRHWRMFY